MDTCNCCEGLSAVTPAEITNRPGLNAIAYRVGTQALFRESLLARLSSSGQPALQGLTTRDPDDISIALLDAWAVVADVLTFYQERIANEAFLRTATERLSILELANLIGYQLRPGLAASTYLAFALDTSSAALGPLLLNNFTQNSQVALPPVTIPTGTKVQSIPAPGEQAQTFETTADIVAHPEWNAIQPRLSKQQQVSATMDSILFKGVSLSLAKGDVLLLQDGVTQQLRRIQSVTVDATAGTTKATLTAMPGSEAKAAASAAESRKARAQKEAVAARAVAAKTSEPNAQQEIMSGFALNAGNITSIVGSVYNQDDLYSKIYRNKWYYKEVAAGVASVLASQPPLEGTGVHVFRKTANVFGYNAPQKVTFSGSPPNPSYSEWPIDGSESATAINLDNAYPEILPGTFIAVQQAGQSLESGPLVIQLSDANLGTRTAYNMSGKTTTVRFDALPGGDSWYSTSSPHSNDLSALRGITIYGQSEPLILADQPIPDDIEGNSILLNSLYLGLVTGQAMILTGNRTDLPGVTGAEFITPTAVTAVNGYTQLTLQKPLTNTYAIKSVYINANIAPATHGETVSEILGSGDAAQVFQEFKLKQPPLTYVSSQTAAGIATTLSIRVNDILWEEVPSFYGHGPEETIYITRRDDDGNTSVLFGDGKTGARLPTGQNNLKAYYRKGIGTVGLVAANQLTQMLNRPGGVKSVSNPLDAAGAADPEVLTDARSNATLTIFTLDRVVSLKDYEDFSRAFPGIAKALATWAWNGQRRNVYLTVAGTDGATIDPASNPDLYNKLVGAINDAGDPSVPLTVSSYDPITFLIGGSVRLDPRYEPDKVMVAIDAALHDNFSFENRSFGQPVAYSEVVSVIQQVEGVLSSDIDVFYLSTDASPSRQTWIPAEAPVSGDGTVPPAQLLTLDPRPVKLTINP